MKKLRFLLVGAFIYTTVSSQSITIRFEGTANNSANNNRDYTVNLDGRKYYSTGTEATGNGVKKIMVCKQDCHERW